MKGYDEECRLVTGTPDLHGCMTFYDYVMTKAVELPPRFFDGLSFDSANRWFRYVSSDSPSFEVRFRLWDTVITGRVRVDIESHSLNYDRARFESFLEELIAGYNHSTERGLRGTRHVLFINDQE